MVHSIHYKGLRCLMSAVVHNIVSVCNETDLKLILHTHTGPPAKPSAPKSLTAKFENGDLSISWEADDTELNPASFYSGTITFNDTSARKREANVITFETVETGYTVEDVDTSKDYEIEVCAHNDGGQSCTDPYYLEGEPASLRESDESDDTNPGTIVLAVLIPLLIAVCVLILVLLFLVFVRIHNWDSYSPEDKGMTCRFLFVLSNKFRSDSMHEGRQADRQRQTNISQVGRQNCRGG